MFNYWYASLGHQFAQARRDIFIAGQSIAPARRTTRKTRTAATTT